MRRACENGIDEQKCGHLQDGMQTVGAHQQNNMTTSGPLENGSYSGLHQTNVPPSPPKNNQVTMCFPIHAYFFAGYIMEFQIGRIAKGQLGLLGVGFWMLGYQIDAKSVLKISQIR